MSKIAYYNFIVNNKHTGYFQLVSAKDRIDQYICFKMENRQIYSQHFSIKTDWEKVFAYRFGKAGKWVDVHEKNHFPTSAFPLLLQNLKTKRTYIAINESNNSVLGSTTLEKNGETVVEKRNGKICRMFQMEQDTIIKIDWGNAVSELCADLAEAKGSII